MTLEAGKEMDKRCVLNWLNEVYVTPSRAFNEYTDDELKMFAHDAIVLLKEQENEEERILKIVWDVLHGCVSTDTVADQDYVYEKIRNRVHPMY